MAPKVADASVERGERLCGMRHHSLRGEVVATYIGQWGDHYWLTREPL